jgi:hypothetical protein
MASRYLVSKLLKYELIKACYDGLNISALNKQSRVVLERTYEKAIDRVCDLLICAPSKQIFHSTRLLGWKPSIQLPSLIFKNCLLSSSFYWLYYLLQSTFVGGYLFSLSSQKLTDS